MKTKSPSALLVLVTMTVLHACSPSDSTDHDPGVRSPGRLVIVGGALQAENAAVYESIIEARAGDGPA